MRIAFLTNEFVTEDNTSGGLSNYLVRVAHGLISLGHRPAVFVRSHVNEETSYDGIRVFRIRPEPGILIKAVDILSMKRFSGPLRVIAFSRACRETLLREHAREPFDIVQAASYDATALCRTDAIPVVVRLSSIEALWRQAYEKPLTLAQRVYEYQEKKAMQQADGVFAPSVVIAENARKMFGIPARVIEPPFVAEKIVSDASAANGCRDKDFLLFFGSLGRLKGCGVIAEMLPELFRKHPGIHFMFAGRMENYRGRPMIEYLYERAGRYKTNVVYLGALSHAALYPILQRARAVVLPSLIDNLPNTCLESMDLGKVVIGTKGTSFEQLIEDRVSGFLALPGDPVSLLACIDSALGLPPAEQVDMATRAQGRIRELAIDKTIPALIRYYGQVIDERGRMSP